jgi:glycosyltransferase involved in cell wall biosynthesis
MSDNAGAFSFPEGAGRNQPPPHLSNSDLSRLAVQASLSSYPEVPTGHGFCLYLRRDMLDAVGLLDAAAFPRGYGEENDLSMRAAHAGFRHVLDDRTYVRHRQSASFGGMKAGLMAAGRAVVDERYPEYVRLVRSLATDEAMLGVRWRLRRAFSSGRRPRPRLLFVIATDTGGTPQTNLDLMRALEDRYEPWLLRSDGRELTLRCLEGGTLIPVEQMTLERPIGIALHRSEEYDDVVSGILLRHAIELVHIRHLAWHGLNLPRLARTLGIPVVLSLHDFYIVCPTIKLLDDRMAHCAGRCTAGEGACQAELWPSEQVPHLKHHFIHRWRDMLQPALEACDAFVTTSPRAREIIEDAYPMLADRDFRVIQHGRSFVSFQPPARVPDPGSVLRVLVPGNISVAKGAELLREMAELDGGRQIEFHVLGDHGSLRPAPGLVLHGRYAREEFDSRVREINPHLGAVLSIWPETYCHTLTELWASGLPVFALDLGATGERLRRHGGGWLADLQAPRALLDALLAATLDREAFQRRLKEVTIWQSGEGMARDTAAMAVDYDVLYRELAHRRLAFAGRFEAPAVWLVVDAREVPKEETPEAFRNHADASLIFRPVAPGAVMAVLEGTDAAGVVLLSERVDHDATQLVLADCAASGLPCVYVPSCTPSPAELDELARHGRVTLAALAGTDLPDQAPLPILELRNTGEGVHARLITLSAAARRRTDGGWN